MATAAPELSITGSAPRVAFINIIISLDEILSHPQDLGGSQRRNCLGPSLLTFFQQVSSSQGLVKGHSGPDHRHLVILALQDHLG